MSDDLLRVDGARKRYGAVTALDGVDCAVSGGEVLALLGPNGAGKSTLIRAITTLERLDEGRVTVAGCDVRADPAGARAALGYAGQDAALDKVLTGRETLRFQAGLVHLPRAAARERIAALLARFGLEEAADRPVEGYSGGMRRRLELAAAMLHEPRLLVLDEPSSGLDYDARRELWGLLETLCDQGTALLLATHDFEEAGVLADRAVLLSHGRVARAGTPEALRAELGAWIVSAKLHEHTQDGDRERLRALFADVEGTELPPDPGRPEFAVAMPGEPDGERTWAGWLQERAAAQDLDLVTVGQRRPTLQDAYLAATRESPEAAA